MFRGLAPVVGALHLAVDQLLREDRGKDTPFFVVHGVHDFIFPVTFTRQTCNLLKQIGYNVTYEELPEWGHAFPLLDQRAAGAGVVRVAARQAVVLIVGSRRACELLRFDRAHGIPFGLLVLADKKITDDPLESLAPLAHRCVPRTFDQCELRSRNHAC